MMVVDAYYVKENEEINYILFAIISKITYYCTLAQGIYRNYV